MNKVSLQSNRYDSYNVSTSSLKRTHTDGKVLKKFLNDDVIAPEICSETILFHSPYFFYSGLEQCEQRNADDNESFDFCAGVIKWDFFFYSS